MTTYLCTDERFLAHRAPREHPERPERLGAIERSLDAAGLLPWAQVTRPGQTSPLQHLPAREVTDEEILRAHSPAHLAHLRAVLTQPGLQPGYLDPDTFYNSATWEAARYAAGAAVEMTLRVLGSERDNGMVLCRPPGHHATRAQAMGFCLLNNVAIAAEAARARGARVAVVDFDVHHGNGTEDILAEEADALYISTHQAPLYPGTGPIAFTGRGRGQGSIINIPLPARSGDAVYLTCFLEVIAPALQRFRPDLLLVSAGFDGHDRDPLAEMALSARGYAAIARVLLSVQPRLVACLEGGYNLAALGESVTAFVRALVLAGEEQGAGLEDAAALAASAPLPPAAREALSKVRRLHELGAEPPGAGPAR